MFKNLFKKSKTSQTPPKDIWLPKELIDAEKKFEEFKGIPEQLAKAAELAKAGNTEEAKKIYWMAAERNFDGSDPYNRLAILYRKEKDYDNEIKILEIAIDVFQNKVNSDRTDRTDKLEKFQDRLQRAKELKEKIK